MVGPFAERSGSGPLSQGSAAERKAYGSRLLPQILDERAASNPDRVYATNAFTPEVPSSYCEVTYGQVAKSTNFFARWLKERVDYGKDFETLAYMGLPDLRNPIIFLAAVKCGYKVCSNRSFTTWQATKPSSMTSSFYPLLGTLLQRIYPC